MGVYIKGMELPKDGTGMYCIVFSDGKACASYKPLEWHEVVTVSTHGQLIDADALFNNLERTGWYNNADRDIAENLVLDAPTVIDAEGNAE